jgi:mannose-6-phosphate isomerase-like protein (cupin superfamily)
MDLVPAGATAHDPPMKKVNIEQKLASFSDQWSPHIIGELNAQYVKLVKIQGEFVWHHHEHEDEMFMVVKGSFVLRLRDGDIRVNQGEFVIVPRGVEHQPFAEEECHIVLFEPATTLNTGNVRNERTRETLPTL